MIKILEAMLQDIQRDKLKTVADQTINQAIEDTWLQGNKRVVWDGRLNLIGSIKKDTSAFAKTLVANIIQSSKELGLSLSKEEKDDIEYLKTFY